MTPEHYIYYSDPRRFGRIEILDWQYLPELQRGGSTQQGISFLGLGPDLLNPLLVEGDDRAARIWRERMAFTSPNAEIKNCLLDQSLVAGLGNIYASELLFRCHIHPQTTRNKISRYQIGRLAKFSSKLLRWAISAKGTSFSGANIYQTPKGKLGGFQKFLAVYGREGQPCLVCGKRILKIYQNSRSTYFCPHCQQK